jgi:hypothetical protein
VFPLRQEGYYLLGTFDDGIIVTRGESVIKHHFENNKIHQIKQMRHDMFVVSAKCFKEELLVV